MFNGTDEHNRVFVKVSGLRTRKKVFIFEIFVLYVNTYISNPGAFHFE